MNKQCFAALDQGRSLEHVARMRDVCRRGFRYMGGVVKVISPKRKKENCGCKKSFIKKLCPG
jgi:hypothetical protein